MVPEVFNGRRNGVGETGSECFFLHERYSVIVFRQVDQRPHLVRDGRRGSGNGVRDTFYSFLFIELVSGSDTVSIACKEVRITFRVATC